MFTFLLQFRVPVTSPLNGKVTEKREKNEMIFCAFIILFYLCIDKYNLNKN